MRVIGAISASQFSGSGANLFDISASAIVGLSLNRIATGSVSASVYSENGTGSMHISNNTTVTGSLRVSGDLFIQGAQFIEYITASQLDISTNIISVNASNPGVRFGGMSVYDSGSTSLTGSFLYDSTRRQWIYSNPSSSITAVATMSISKSAAMLVGPENTGSQGDEQGINKYSIPVGEGGIFLTSSALVVSQSKFISTLDTIVSGTFTVTGSSKVVGQQTLTGSFNFTGSLIGSSSTIHLYQSTSVSGTNIFGTASWAETASYAMGSEASQVITVAVKAGMALTKGQVVRISGVSGTNILVATASYVSESTSTNTLGVILTDLALNATGSVLTQGLITGINTNGFIAGQDLYLGANGNLTNVEPEAPNHTVRMGIVTRVNSSNGEAFIKVDNGYEIGELHDVLDNSTASSHGDLLVKSGSVWTNSNTLTGSYVVSGTIEFYNEVTGANILATSSYAVSASYAPIAGTAETMDGGIFF